MNSRIFQGQLPQVQATVARALACPTLTESDVLHLQTANAIAGVSLGDPEALAQARTIARTAPRSVARGTAHDTIAQWELFAGHADRALAEAEHSDEMREPEELGSRIWTGSGIRTRIWEAVALIDLDRLDQASALLDAEIAGRLAAVALPHAFKAACHYHAGQYAQAQRDCAAATEAAKIGGSFKPASVPAIAATIALREGRIADADALVGHAEAIRGPAEILGDTIVRWTRALILEAQGQPTAAAEAAAEALAAYTRAGFVSYLAWHAPDLVRISLAAAASDTAAAAVAAAEQAAAQLTVGSRRAAALRARGLISDDARLLVEAVSVARQVPRPLDLAFALRDAAAALARAGDHAAARPYAAEALELLATLGAAGDERSTRQLMRAAGLYLARGARHKSTATGWDSLTPAERKIVVLAAERRTNPEIAQALFISRSTVAWHLSNIYKKLDVTSRVQLAAEARRRNQPTQVG